MKNIGTVNLQDVNFAPSMGGGRTDQVALGIARDCHSTDRRGRVTDAAAPSSSNAFLVSELEKRDPLVRRPLTTFTWSKNLPVKVGGGWIEYASNLNIDYGISGGTGDGLVSANGVNSVPVVQGNFGKDLYRAHIVAMFMRINEFDMERANVTGRSLDSLLSKGVRLGYEKHMDQSCFIGLPTYGTTGLLNHPGVFGHLVAEGAAVGTPTDWAHKTPDEILLDVNNGIADTWGRSGNDMAAIPNHILIPFEQYNYLISTKVSAYAEKSIMAFLMENNLAQLNGDNLVFGCSNYCKNAGESNSDRMVIYRSEEEFIAVEELQPLTRRRTIYNSDALSFDTLYAANVSEVELFYTQTISYYDGI